MEWTLDYDYLNQNPLMREAGRSRILELINNYGVKVGSLTGDCFMQVPFYKSYGLKRLHLLQDLQEILEASRQVGIKYVVMPLVDDGSLESKNQETSLLDGLLPLSEYLVSAGIKILFESDFQPEQLFRFINQFPEESFGINYDIGNSASLGYSPSEEIMAYGHRIDNVHVKDRMLHGTTVPLGLGNSDFDQVFTELRKLNYKGDFILQTARADNKDHAGTLAQYRDMTLHWMKVNGFET